MKRIPLALIVLLFTANVSAWEFKDNPDRFPSVGLNTSTGHLTGNRSENSSPSNPWLNRVEVGDESNYFYSIGGDVRLPVNSSLTLTGSFSQISSDSHFTRQSGIYKEDASLTGYQWGLGMRLYFNR